MKDLHCRIGGTRQQELQRSAEFYVELVGTQGPYFALAMLYDSQYDREDIRAVMDIMEARRLGMEPLVRRTEDPT